jgi:hypothetical protein
VYSYDTLQENSLLMASNRIRLLAGQAQAHEGSYEQVVTFLRFGAVGTDQFHGAEGSDWWIDRSGDHAGTTATTSDDAGATAAT